MHYGDLQDVFDIVSTTLSAILGALALTVLTALA